MRTTAARRRRYVVRILVWRRVRTVRTYVDGKYADTELIRIPNTNCHLVGCAPLAHIMMMMVVMISHHQAARCCPRRSHWRHARRTAATEPRCAPTTPPDEQQRPRRQRISTSVVVSANRAPTHIACLLMRCTVCARTAAARAAERIRTQALPKHCQRAVTQRT